MQVEHGGKTYALRVLELQPASAVSIIDTDIAADVGPSIETEGYLRQQQEELARQQERLRQLEEQRAEVALQVRHTSVMMAVWDERRRGAGWQVIAWRWPLCTH